MSLGLISPWVNYYKQLEALFKNDPKVGIEFIADPPEVKLYVDGQAKADALAKLLPEEKKFGNQILKITIIPSNSTEEDFVTLFKTAFEGNPAFTRAFVTPLTPQSFGATYLMFKKEVVQYYNDDLSDANRRCSTLYQDIARDVFTDAPGGVYFSTELEESVVGVPLGEWP